MPLSDENEIEIVKQHGVAPIVACAAMVAEALDNDMNGETSYTSLSLPFISFFMWNVMAGKSGYPAREMQYILELAAQCCRALRNLSVNRKLLVIIILQFGYGV